MADNQTLILFIEADHNLIDGGGFFNANNDYFWPALEASNIFGISQHDLENREGFLEQYNVRFVRFIEEERTLFSRLTFLEQRQHTRRIINIILNLRPILTVIVGTRLARAILPLNTNAVRTGISLSFPVSELPEEEQAVVENNDEYHPAFFIMGSTRPTNRSASVVSIAEQFRQMEEVILGENLDEE